MTSAEQQTIRMLNNLPFSSLKKIQKYLDNLLVKNNTEIEPLSKKEILEKLKKSEADYKAGRVYSWKEVKNISHTQYEL